jgi:methylglutaconyl-CoA hydratase
VHAVYSTTDIHQETEILINQLLKNGPCALTRAKQLIDRVAGSRLDDSLVKYTVEAIAKTRVSAEGQEGLQAFLDKRQPAWME